MIERKIKDDRGCHITEAEPLLTHDLRQWVQDVTSDGDMFLAHADDGVIWGYQHEGKLRTSHDVVPQYSPILHHKTLQDIRIFNQAREIKVWRTASGLRQITISDADPTEIYTGYLDETHLLWGTKAKIKDDFILLEHGEEGLFHAIPYSQMFDPSTIDESKRFHLQIRHYIREAGNGVNSIAMSRLVTIGESYEQS